MVYFVLDCRAQSSLKKLVNTVNTIRFVNRLRSVSRFSPLWVSIHAFVVRSSLSLFLAVTVPRCHCSRCHCKRACLYDFQMIYSFNTFPKIIETCHNNEQNVNLSSNLPSYIYSFRSRWNMKIWHVESLYMVGLTWVLGWFEFWTERSLICQSTNTFSFRSRTWIWLILTLFGWVLGWFEFWTDWS